MNDYAHTITELSQRATQSWTEALFHEDRLTRGLREALRSGISIDDISEITGLTPSEIRRRTSTDRLSSPTVSR